MNIYVHKDGTQYGPYSLEQLQQYLQQGSFTLEDQACHDGQNWVSVGQIPGIAQAATSPAQPASQPQAQASAPQKAAAKKKTVSAKTKQTATPGQHAKAPQKGKGGSKALFLFGGLGIVLIGLIAGLCYILFSGDDEEVKEDKLIADSGDSTQENSSSEKEEESTPAPATSSSGPSISLLERIPSDSGAVIMVRVNDILEKGREDIAALLPPELPPMVGKALEDPSTLGLDVSEPLQIHIIPNEDLNLAPSGGIAGKLSDKEKFMNTIELLAGLDSPVQKDGYLLYAPLGNSEPQIAVGSDFFFAGFADKPADRETAIDEFMIADGSDSLIKTNESFTSITEESNDLSIWFGGDSILETLSQQMDNANLDTIKGGSGSITLNFEQGEMVAQMKIEAPNNEMVYGRGGFSDGMLKFAPMDAILALGFSLDLAKFLEFAEKEILPEIGDEVKLDEPIPELGGLSPLDAINAFTGEFLVSITDIKMPAPAAGAGGPGADPFGGAAPPEANPFGDPEMEEGDVPFPPPGGAGGFPGGGPPGGMNPGAMMMAAMPKPEFIVAASIDSEKWLKLKAAPPLHGNGSRHDAGLFHYGER